MRALLTILATVVLVSSATTHAAGQSYPSGPITLAIPLTPGDAGDVSGRTMAEELAKLLKVPCPC